MLLTIAEDENNDWFLDVNGNIAIQQDSPEAVGTLCKAALQTILGELPLFVDVGINYPQFVWIGNPDKKQVDFIFRDTLIAVQDVVSIVQYVSVLEEDVYFFSAIIETAYGNTTLTSNSILTPQGEEPV